MASLRSNLQSLRSLLFLQLCSCLAPRHGWCMLRAPSVSSVLAASSGRGSGGARRGGCVRHRHRQGNDTQRSGRGTWNSRSVARGRRRGLPTGVREIKMSALPNLGVVSQSGPWFFRDTEDSMLSMQEFLPAYLCSSQDFDDMILCRPVLKLLTLGPACRCTTTSSRPLIRHLLFLLKPLA